ncbi:autotransporter outer membrane beta-barrel domain-containing protein [Ancylobacter terrae]|uniref:autotransporter outer membrane beta-barrel domain-containing protein n=1 Tax=Ancylobacter sp. sgz301288 TaxID=3342077 RepID=UPI00385A57D3
MSFGTPNSPLLATVYDRLNEQRRREDGSPAPRAFAPDPTGAPAADALDAAVGYGAPVGKAAPAAFEAALDASPDPSLAWFRLVGRFGNSSATDTTPAVDMHGGALFGGLDLGYDANTRYGIALGVSSSKLESADDRDQLDASGYHVSAYATHADGPWRMRAIASYSYYDLDSTRTFFFKGLDYTAAGSYAADNVEALGEVSYVTSLGSVTAEPYIALGLSWLDTGSFTEAGRLPRGTALNVEGQTQTWPYTLIGARFSSPFLFGNTIVAPSLDLGWRHVFGDVNPDTIYSIGDTNFAISGIPIAEDSLVLGLGLDATFAYGIRGSAKYLGDLAEEAQAHTFTVGLAIPF